MARRMRSTRTVSAPKTLLGVLMAFWHALCTGAPGVIPCPAGRGPCQIGTWVRGMGRNMAAKEEVPAPGLEPGQQTPKDCGLPITPCRTKATDCDGGRRKRRSHCLRYRSGLPHAKRAACCDSGHPALDPPVEPGAATDIDPQASVVVLAYVRPHSLRVVALQHRTAELARLRAHEFQPELLRCFGICVLVDVHPEYQVVPCDSGDIQESEEERAPSAARLRISS